MTREFARRVGRVEPSATLAISALAKELRGDGIDVIDLGVGEPDFPTPENVINAGIAAMEAGHTGYTPPAGIPELRSAIANHLKAIDLQYTPDQIIVTPGAKQALYETIQTLIDDGDEVILLDPAWVSYEAMIKLAGGTVRRVDLTPYEFQLEPALEDIAEAITPATRLLIVNTPSNPTGVVYSDAALRGLSELLVEEDVMAISDEIYGKITFEDRPRSLATFPDMDDRTVTVNGFSKAYSMTGWRLGYLAGPDDIIAQAGKLHSHSVSCATNFVQHAGIEALTNTSDSVDTMVAAFESRRDRVVQLLTDIGVSLPSVPGGAFYLMVPVEGDDTETCERALSEAHVATVPGSAFGAPGFARLSYAADINRIESAIERLGETTFFSTD